MTEAATPLVYLAHPIDQGTIDYVLDAETLLKSRGCGVFHPARAWALPPAGGIPHPALQQANLDVLTHCDGLLAMLHRDRLSAGVVLEIAAAQQAEIPVIVQGDLAPSWALSYLGVEEAYENITEAVDALCDLIETAETERTD